MTARSIRRAAERKAQKAARKSQRFSAAALPDELDFAPECEHEISEARLRANRLNAQSSTCPRTLAGKSISSLTAGDEAAVLSVPKIQIVVTGLTGRTVLLPSDDAAAYQQHLALYAQEYKPVGLRELELVQSLADTRWRLNRISGLEMAIYASGLTELETYLKYEKQLKNLHLQEARLNRRFDKEMSELRQLQKDRQQPVESEPCASASVPANRPESPLGFEFSTAAPSTADTQIAPPETTALPQAA